MKLACQCGKVRAEIRNPSSVRARRYVCYCDDCQAFARFLGGTERILDANGGTEVVPFYPANIAFLEGTEFLQCMRLSPNGLYRWYAECCRTPVANCPRNDKLPYAGVNHAFLAGDEKHREAEFGPISGRIMGKFGRGNLPPGTPSKMSFKVIRETIPFLLKGRLLKLHRPTPFFRDGQPTMTPKVLTKEERKDL